MTSPFLGSIPKFSDALLNRLSPDVTHPPNMNLNGVFEFIVDYLENFQASIFFCTLKDLEGSSNR